MNIPKSEPTPGKDAREPSKSGTAQPAAAASAKIRTRMSLEKKLGITFIGALLTVFCGVLGVRLWNVGSDDAKVEINLGSQPGAKTEATAQAAVSAPQPTIVAERTTAPNKSSTAPATAFAAQSSLPSTNTPPTHTPPAAYMPPPPTNATVNATVGSAPRPSSPPGFGGDRYATSTSNVAPSPAITASPPGSSMAATGSGNPLRSVGSMPPATNSASLPASSGNNSSYGAATTYNSGPSYSTSPAAASAAAMPNSSAGRYSSGASASVAAPVASLPAVPSVVLPSPPSFGNATGNVTAEPRPFGGTASSAQPLNRDPGVAAIGLTTGGTASLTTAPSAASPAYASSPAFATPTTTVAPTAATISAPAQVAASATPQAQPYVVAPDDSFWSIAQKVYGNGAYYRALFAYNSDRYPHAEDVRTGSVLDVPSVEVLKAKFPELCVAGGGAVAAGGASPAMTGRTGVAVAARTYVVQEGDTLFDIARRQLGKASYWSEIYNLNRAALGENLDRLQPGTELMLPAVQ